MNITQLRHAWPEKAGFFLERKSGHPEYTFLHFFNSVELLVGGETVRTRPHACILYNIATPQRIASSQLLTHDWIHFTGELEPHFTRYGLECDRLYYPSRADFITEIIQEMEFELYSAKPYSDALMERKLDELFIKLSRACSGANTPAVDPGTNERLRLLRGEIFSSLGKPWTVEDMASRVGLSQSRFYTVYKSVYGNSPVDDLIRARIDSAKNALRFGNASLAQIAETLGYANLTHFMRQFKAFTGMTPDTYRKQSE